MIADTIIVSVRKENEEKSYKKKYEHLEKMICLQAEYVAKIDEKLKIAKEALEEIVADESCVSCMNCLGSAYAEKALAKIKDIK